MAMGFIPQFAQVYIHYFSNKTRSTTKLFISEPGNVLESKMGKLFGIIEINTPSRENSKIINQIISDLEEVYYSFDTSGITHHEAFERTLKKVNDDFMKLIAEDNSYKVGNLNEYTIKEKINFVIGLLNGNDIIITSLNNIGAFLIHKTNQDFKTINILQGEDTDESLDKVRLFNNVISGEVAESDNLFFCNNDFLNFISKERFTKTITSLSSNKAADYFKNSLLQHEGFNFAAILIHMQAEDSSRGGIPKSLSSIDELNTHETDTERLLSPSFVPNVAKFIKEIFSKRKKKEEVVKNDLDKEFSVAENFEASTEYEAIIAKDHGDDVVIEERIVHTSSEELDPVKEDTSFDEVLEDNIGVDSGRLDRSADEVKKTSNIDIKKWYTNAISNICRFYKARRSRVKLNITLNGVKSVIRLRINQFRNKLAKIPRISKILILVFIIAVILFAYSIIFVKEKNFSILKRTTSNEQISKISETLDEAESKLIFGDNAEAKRLIALVETDLSSVKVESSQDQEYMANIANRLNALVAKLRNITLIEEPALLATMDDDSGLAADIVSVAYNNDEVYVFNATNNSVTNINTRSREVKSVSGSFSGSVVNSNVVDSIVFFVTDDNSFYKIEDNTITSVPVTIQEEEKVTDFTFYNDRLYNLVPSSNQIFRHPKVGSGYGAGLTWIQESGISISGANSIGIDNRVWISTDDGQIMKFFKGFKQAFSIKDVDPGIEKIDKMVKAEDSDYIYILEKDKNRIVVLDDKGNLVTQYFSEELDNVTSFDVDEDGRAIYLANGDKIYAVIMSHL